MKTNKQRLMLAGLFLCAAAMPVFAGERSREEKKLEAAGGELDKSAVEAEAQPRVTDKIQTQFGVDGARVQALRDRKLGYGEISIALGLAQSLPGGITDANVDKIMALRQGPPVMGWGRLARELGLKLGPVQSKVRKINSDLKKDKKDGMEKGEKSEKTDKPEKREKHEKMDKPERPANSGKR